MATLETIEQKVDANAEANREAHANIIDRLNDVRTEARAAGVLAASNVRNLTEHDAWLQNHEKRHSRDEVQAQAWAGWGRQVGASLLGPGIIGIVFLGLRSAGLL